MACRRCPHHIRHGQVSEKQEITFQDRCALAMKAGKQEDCLHYPFGRSFHYMNCSVYQATFKSAGVKNDVVPTKDFQYSEALAGGGSLTDMDLL